jgi:hypothetical protein
MRCFAFLLALSMAVSALVAPGAWAFQSGWPAGDAPQAHVFKAVAAGIAERGSELRSKRHCASQTALSQGSPACQLDKSMPDAAFAPAARARSIAYAPETAPALRHRGPAPEHGPPRHLS